MLVKKALLLTLALTLLSSALPASASPTATSKSTKQAAIQKAKDDRDAALKLAKKNQIDKYSALVDALANTYLTLEAELAKEEAAANGDRGLLDLADKKFNAAKRAAEKKMRDDRKVVAKEYLAEKKKIETAYRAAIKAAK
ncbi:MAG: hypothetical protein ACKOW9_01800 [Candidatus Paceibacterota bacterium]